MRDSHLPPGPDEQDDPEGADEDDGLSPAHLAPLGSSTLVGVVLLGLVLGWALHPLADAWGDARPVTWLQGVTLWFLGAALGCVAYVTRRQVRAVGTVLDGDRMVNRLVLARASTLVGALVAGAYLGYGLTWLGSHPDLVVERVVRAGVASLGGLVVLLCGKLLERACRVPPGGPHP